MLKPIGPRKEGVPTREEMYQILKSRSLELQKSTKPDGYRKP